MLPTAADDWRRKSYRIGPPTEIFNTFHPGKLCPPVLQTIGVTAFPPDSYPCQLHGLIRTCLGKEYYKVAAANDVVRASFCKDGPGLPLKEAKKLRRDRKLAQENLMSDAMRTSRLVLTAVREKLTILTTSSCSTHTGGMRDGEGDDHGDHNDPDEDVVPQVDGADSPPPKRNKKDRGFPKSNGNGTNAKRGHKLYEDRVSLEKLVPSWKPTRKAAPVYEPLSAADRGLRGLRRQSRQRMPQ